MLPDFASIEDDPLSSPQLDNGQNSRIALHTFDNHGKFFVHIWLDATYVKCRREGRLRRCTVAFCDIPLTDLTQDPPPALILLPMWNPSFTRLHGDASATGGARGCL